MTGIDFLRETWVSDRAREKWQPRFQQIAAAWPRIVIHAVAEGVCGGALRTIAPSQIFPLQSEARARKVAVEVLRVCGIALPSHALRNAPGPGRPFLYETAFGEMESAATCCAQVTPQPDANETIVEAPHSPASSPFLRLLRLQPLPYVPCRFDCENASDRAGQWIAYGRDAGFDQEMDWVEEIGAWPVEMSSLHGIAELRSPVLKICAPTAYTPRKITVRWRGSTVPAESAVGLSFPFLPPQCPSLTESPSFQRGLVQLSETEHRN